MYWVAIASGALAIQRATTSGTTLPSATGRSRYRGGLSGFGDHAAAEASIACGPKDSREVSFSMPGCAARVTVATSGSRLAPRQQGLIAYQLEKTSGYFMARRIVP